MYPCSNAQAKKERRSTSQVLTLTGLYPSALNPLTQARMVMWFTSVRSCPVSQPKSDAAKRTITLSNNAIDVLKRHQSDTDSYEGFVFKTSTGNPISQRKITRHFHSALDKAGLPRISFHTLRHTAATLMLQSNVHPRLVQEMLGHSTIVLTLDTYSHVIPDHPEEVAAEMDRIFG